MAISTSEFHMTTLNTTIIDNVKKYLNNEIKPDNPDYYYKPFIDDLTSEYLTIIDIFRKHKDAYIALLDERGFEIDAADYKNEVFRKCNYIDFAFSSNSKSIKYPFNKIAPEVLVDKMKKIKSFIDENVQKQKESPSEAIKELAQLNNPDYIFRINDADGMENKHLLGTRFKSFLLYHNFPDYYPEMTNNDLYAMYMLTAKLEKPNPKNCEFVVYHQMGLNSIDVNKDYPYELFVHYVSNIYEEIKKNLKEKNISWIDEASKFIVVEAFLHLVYKYNEKYLIEVTHINFKPRKY